MRNLFGEEIDAKEDSKIESIENEEVKELVKKTIEFFEDYGVESFINSENELILIPKINAYFRLEDVNSREDFLTKVIAWLCYYGAENHWNNRFSPMMCQYISYICETDFEEEDIDRIYCNVSGSLERSRNYVKSNFDERYLTKCEAR